MWANKLHWVCNLQVMPVFNMINVCLICHRWEFCLNFSSWIMFLFLARVSTVVWVMMKHIMSTINLGIHRQLLDRTSTNQLKQQKTIMMRKQWSMLRNGSLFFVVCWMSFYRVVFSLDLKKNASSRELFEQRHVMGRYNLNPKKIHSNSRIFSGAHGMVIQHVWQIRLRNESSQMMEKVVTNEESNENFSVFRFSHAPSPRSLLFCFVAYSFFLVVNSCSRC